MKKIFGISFIEFLFFCKVFYGQSEVFNNSTDSNNYQSVHFLVNVLADDSMGGRYAGSVYELKTIDFIKKYFQNSVDKNYIFNTDTFTYCCRNDSIVTAHNISIWPKKSTKKIIILAAHYDHLSPGSMYSKEIWDKNKIHPGADDNASGVAMAITLFRYFGKNVDNLNYDFALLLFSGHEEGLQGSKNWIEKNFKPSDNIVLMLNFDMVGRFSDETNLVSVKIDEKNKIIEQLTHSALQSGVKLSFNSNKFIDTDSYIFYKQKILAFTLSTGIHSDYHRISDTPDKINYVGMTKIMEFIKLFLKNY
ncbi:MAG: M28 family peptidase [Eubacteriales bacterium]